MTLDYPVPFHTPNLVWDSTIAIYLFLLGISSGAALYAAIQLAKLFVFATSVLKFHFSLTFGLI